MISAVLIILILIIVILVLTRVWIKVTSGRFTIDRDLKNLNIYVTGSTAGLGLVTCRELAKNGARVYMLCRNTIRGQNIASEMKSETGNDQIFVIECNLSSLKSVRACADKILASNEPINILINNAGMGGQDASVFQKTEDGLNEMMQSNHFGHFLLTNLLLDKLKSTPGSRVVNVSSGAHVMYHDFDINDINYDNQTGKDKLLRLYAWSKLANILFTRELAKKIYGSGVTTNSLHPGAIVTEIGKPRQGSFPMFGIFVFKLWVFLGKFLKNQNEGIQTHLYLALSDNLKHVSGHYFSDCKPAATSLMALNDKLATELWEKSVQCTKLDK